MYAVISPLYKIAHYRALLFSAVKSEVKQRYAGSVMGLFWPIIYPMLMFAIYLTLYLVIFRVRPTDMNSHQYVLYIMGGLIPFLSFSEALSTGTTSLSGKMSLLVNTVYPSEFIPLQAVLTSHVNIIFGLCMLFGTKLIFTGHLGFAMLVLPVVVVLQIMFVTGIVWFLSVLNLVLKDVQQSLTFITMIIMIISPIAYTPSMVPSALKLMIWLNPYSYFVRAYQDILYNGHIGANFYVASFLAISTFYLGNLFFNKVKKDFYDYV